MCEVVKQLSGFSKCTTFLVLEDVQEHPTAYDQLIYLIDRGHGNSKSGINNNTHAFDWTQRHWGHW